MPLTVVQGPLPPDGTQIDPSVKLEAWIAGTQVFDLPIGAFKGGTFQFVVSQTDAPATAERTLGLLWFERGRGLLYLWDDCSAPSSVPGWIAIGGRRDIWVENAAAAATCPVGAPLCSAIVTPYSLTAAVTLIPEPATGLATGQGLGPTRNRPIWRMFPMIPDASTATAPAVGEMLFVSLDPIRPSLFGRAVEIGFCDFRCPSGYTGSGGFVGTQGTTVPTGLDSFGGNSQSPVTEVEGFTPCGFLSDSSPSNPGAPWLRPAFKWATPLLVNTGGF